jgi:hypothetical protein
MDDLLERLTKLGAGCYIGLTFVGALAYADDLTLLSPSIGGLQDMVSVAQEYGLEYGVKYNAKKTQCIAFSQKATTLARCIHLDGTPIEWANSVKHLGNVINCKCNESDDVQAKRGALVGKINNIMANFGGLTREVVQKIFAKQCSSHYGSQSWNLGDKSIDVYYVGWKNCIRKIWRLPRNSRTVIIDTLGGKQPLLYQLLSRSAKMYESIIHGQNRLVNAVLHAALSIDKSLVRSNIDFAKMLLNVPADKTFSFQEIIQLCRTHSHDVISDHQYACVCSNVVLELNNVIDGTASLEGFALEDVQRLLCSMSSQRI